MADYFENGLRAMQKSLQDVVLPALDPADPLAREQLALTIDYLAFLRSRLDHSLSRHRFELELYRDMAAAVIGIVGDALPTQDLAEAVSRTATLRSDPWASGAHLREAVAEVSLAIDTLVASVVEHGDGDLRGAVDRVIHAATQQWIELDRAWYAPIAVDPEDPRLKPLESFFPYRKQWSVDAS